MGSDGIWDNLYEKDIMKCVTAKIPKKISSKDKNDYRIFDEHNLQLIANCLTLKAEQLSQEPMYMSPFATEARKHYNDFEARGKPDDVTVIVAQMSLKDEGHYQKTPQVPQGTWYTQSYYNDPRYQHSEG